MNNREVAHLWATQSRPEASGSNFYFISATIFSYGSHFPIARWVTVGKAKERYVLFTSAGYSTSTAKHKSYVKNAITHVPDTHVIYVEDLAKIEYRTEYTKAQFESLRKKEARKIDQLVQRARVYKAEEARARRQAAKINKLSALERLQKWRAGEISNPQVNGTHLRLSADKTRVETSRGAQISVKFCDKVWELVCKTQTCTKDDEFDLGNYRGILVDAPMETVTVGCHTIPFKEINYIAWKLGLAAGMPEMPEDVL